MIEYRIHYLVPGGVRCGRRYWHNGTASSDKVTCKTCKRLMAGKVE